MAQCSNCNKGITVLELMMKMMMVMVMMTIMMTYYVTSLARDFPITAAHTHLPVANCESSSSLNGLRGWSVRNCTTTFGHS